MECGPLRELLSAYVDGESSAEDSLRVEEHLRTCADCAGAERRMRALGVAAARTEAPLSPDFRDRLFARMEREGLLRTRRSIFAFSLRWAVLPLAAAAALGLFLLTSREAPRGPVFPAAPPPAVERRPPDAPPPPLEVAGPELPAGEARAVAGEELSPEEREIVAYLEILEDPQAFEEPGEIDELEIFLAPGATRGQG
jgi:anti-sigma factor RsiW